MIRRIIPETCLALGLPSDMTFEESVTAIMDNWDRRRFQSWPLWPRTLLCRLASTTLPDKEKERNIRDWACREATFWWPVIFNEPPTADKLAGIYPDLVRGRR